MLSFKNLTIKRSLLVLIIALPLSVMTQLRSSYSNLGPGEILLIFWAIFILITLRKEKKNIFENKLTKKFFFFWLISLSAMSIGAIYGHQVYPWDYNVAPNLLMFKGPVHDSLAYLGLAVVTVSLSAYHLTRKELQTTIVSIAIFSALLLYGLLILKYSGLSIEPYTLVGTNPSRFSGLSRNPNQTALLTIIIPFLISAYIENKESKLSTSQLFGFALILAMSWLVGIETRSTAYRLSLLIWFALIFIFWLRLIIRKNYSLTPVIKIIALSFLLAFSLVWMDKSINRIMEFLVFKPYAEARKTHPNAFTFHNRWSDTLYVPDKPEFNFAGDFTVECWFFTMSGLGQHRLFSHWSGEAGGGYLGGYIPKGTYAIAKKNDGNFDGTYIGSVRGPAPTPNEWHHYAYTRSGRTYRLFLDGKELGSVTEKDVDNLTLNVPFFVGSQGDRFFWDGLIDGVRVTNGLARYTSDFIPPPPSNTKSIVETVMHTRINTTENEETNAPDNSKPVLHDNERNLKPDNSKSVLHDDDSSLSFLWGLLFFKDVIDTKSGPRMTLYINGFKALSYSPIVGLGPGPYSGDDAPFEAREVHNSFMDWTVSSGILGGILILALFIWSGCHIWSKRCYSLFCGFIILTLFAQFHHVARHPIVWVFLVLALKISDQKFMESTQSSTRPDPQ